MSDTSGESTGIDVPVCATCGTPIELYGGTGPTLMTSDAHVVGLTTREIESFWVETLAMSQAQVWLRLALDWSERKPPFAWTPP